MSQDANDKVKAANLFNVDGLTVVITGGGSGLGAYMARTLALNGAKAVFILGRRLPSLETVASSVPTKNIHPIQCDVTSKDSLSSAVSTVKSHSITTLDVLIANSGITGPGVAILDADQKPVDIDTLAKNMWAPDFDAVTSTYAVNLTGVHFTIAAFLPLLAEANKQRPSPTAENFRPRPQIITTSSIGGLSRKVLGNLSYGPSKAALIHMTKQLSSTFVPYDIRVNSIAPGLYFSEMTQGMYDAQGKSKMHNVEGQFEKTMVPATRTGDEQDMGGAVLWLCSRAGAYINGQILVTDGGRLGVVPGSY